MSLGREPLFLQEPGHLGLHAVHELVEPFQVGGAGVLVAGLDPMVLDVGGQQPEGAEQSGVEGDHGPGHLQGACHAAGVDGAAAAEGEQNGLPQVAAALGGDGPHGPDHGGVGQQVDAVGRLDQVQPQGGGDLFGEGLLGLAAVEGQAAAHQPLGVDVPQQQVGVGDGGLGPSLVVTDRSRRRPGAARTDVEGPAGVQPGDAASPGAHFGHVDGRNADQVPAAP